jgi:predicted RNase H-like HicB family nuclease
MSEQAEHLHYSMNIEWDPRDDIFVVTVPELPGCQTHGKTYEQAVQKGQEAITGWISAARAWGDRVPPPRLFTNQHCEQTAARIAQA